MRTVSPTSIAIRAALLSLSLPFSSLAAGHSFTYTAHPVHRSLHFDAHGRQPGHGFFGTFFRTLLGVQVEPQSDPAEYERREDAENIIVRPTPEFTVKSDTERYYEATGRELPRVHDLILLPPSAPGADSTYIWPTSDEH